ncbi:ribose-phosphate pyrophosphokinase [Bianquea renquensis]|uniref:ribose-phosphate diphosphokinase n=1 Tax=Bianquea renquensis TaxID=2763661 RepID=A0A926DSX5_9FIRM|nr:ribose-phosphate pyrophosphokinase [Bianquea renquensis]MBC8543174.1 ribose-phosphate pyrophosphokinase [Bianquea renquensis]
MPFDASTESITHLQVANLGLVAMDSASEFGKKVDGHLKKLYSRLEGPQKDADSFLVGVSCPRFQTGDAKAVIGQSVRGMDVYLLTDVGNYNCTYSMFGQPVPMSPDDHYQDLKRAIEAVGGKAHRITVIMPILYGGRQHRRTSRESLDCAVALQELRNMGVHSIITFDAHDPRVQNAVPLMGFDNVMPSYQTLKALLHHVPDIVINKDSFMVVSPDEGAIDRNVYYASVLGVDMGMYYKRRDYSRIVNGRNPIVAHEFLGNDIHGKDVFIYDDIISSGDSMLDIAYDLRKRGAGRIFAGCTYALFTEGVDKFTEAVENGYLSGVLSTNLTYRRPELLEAPWYYEVDVSKYVAYFIASMNHDMSISLLLDPLAKINDLVARHAEKQAMQLELFEEDDE